MQLVPPRAHYSTQAANIPSVLFCKRSLNRPLPLLEIGEMRAAIHLLFVLAVVTTGVPGAYAQSETDQVDAARPQVGNLHRAAATLETTLELYRLALVEIVPAARAVLQAGSTPRATPASDLPPLAAEVFGRLAKSIVRRAPAEALDSVPRAYHAEVVDAMQRLARATTLEQAHGPLRALAAAMANMAEQADAIVDLFSRQRPVRTEVVDPSLVLDDINEALDQLAAAEARIGRLRAQGRSMDELLQAFLGLEIALGHALDLIAAAAEAGVHIGFEVQLSTESFSSTLAAVRSHLGELTRITERMERKPPPLADGLLATVLPPKGRGTYTVALNWPAAVGALQPAEVHLYRRADKGRMVDLLTSLHRCNEVDAEAARKKAEEQTSAVDEKWEPVATLAAGRATYTEELSTSEMVAAPIYRVVPSNAFGVEGDGPEAPAVLVPLDVEPPPLVTAELASTDPASPTFYTGADAVQVRWLPSRNELSPLSEEAHATVLAWAHEHHLPLVESYRVLRLHQGRVTEVGTVDGDQHTLTDRPDEAALRDGVAYYVEAITPYGRAAQTPSPCAASEVKTDLEQPLALAAAGIAYVQHPTRTERGELERLRDPAALAGARATYRARPEAEQHRLLAKWWHSVPEAQRIAWLKLWPSFVPDNERNGWWQEALAHLKERDRPWVMVEVWLLTQPPYMQREIGRWWELLDEGTRRQEVARWRAQLNTEYRRWVDERLAAGDEEALRPAKVLAWWQGRDDSERQRLQELWQATVASERQKLFSDWLEDLDPTARTNLRWPDWRALTTKERNDLLDNAWQELPAGLWPHHLAWLTWNALEDGALTKAVANEVGFIHRMRSQVRYALRPIDAALGFHLGESSVVCALSVVLATVAVRRRRRNRHEDEGGQ